MRKLSFLLVGLLMMLVAVVPVAAQEGTILDVAANNPNFSTLVAAIEAADPSITQALSGPGPYTVFAPTNQAFQNLDSYLQNNFDITLDDVSADQELLTNILLYHVVAGSVFSGQLAGFDDQVVPTIYPGTGIGVTVNDNGSITLNGVADVVIADVAASNGVVHAIDNVIFNSTIAADIQTLSEEVAQAALQAELGNSAAGVAASDPDNFSTLLAVVQASGELPLVNEGLPITVFAPTNAAFDELLGELGMSLDDLLANTELLSTVIRYHVIPGEVTSADMVAEGQGSFRSFLNRESRSTGEPITFDVIFSSLPAGGIELNGSAVITAVDIPADNGIVHVIDEVLLPNEVREALGLPLNPSVEEMSAEATTEEVATEETTTEASAETTGNTIADIVVSSAQAEDPEFTLLLEVVMAADPSVLDALSGEGPLTVFAPTDEAFQALLEVLGLPVDAVLTQGELLTSVLLYHVVPGEYLESDVVGLDGQEVATLLGDEDTILVTVTEDGVVLNDSINVIATNITADNGVIHVIDGVLLPASVRSLLGM